MMIESVKLITSSKVITNHMVWVRTQQYKVNVLNMQLF